MARDSKSFPPYPDFPVLSAAQLDGWLTATKVQVISAIEWDWPGGWQVGPRILTDSMYFWIAKGSGHAWFGDPTHKSQFSAGDLMLIPQGMEHAIYGDEGQQPHVLAVHFNALLFGSINLLDILGFPVHLPHRRGTPYRQVSERLVREYALKAPGSAVAMAAEVWQLLHFILRTQTADFSPMRTAGSESALPRLLPVLHWIDSHLDSHELTVGDLAQQVYLSETHFRRLFHRVFGTSPVQFIRQRRVDRACALLRTTDLPLKQIAQNCGFAEDAFFSRVFHRAVGTSPAAYRKLELI